MKRIYVFLAVSQASLRVAVVEICSPASVVWARLGSGGDVVELFALLNASSGVAKVAEVFENFRVAQGVVNGELGLAEKGVDAAI